MRIRITEDDEGNIAKTNFWNPHYLITEPPVFAFARLRDSFHLLVPEPLQSHVELALSETVEIVATTYSKGRLLIPLKH